MKSLAKLLLIASVVIYSGCAVNRATGTIAPGKELVQTDVFYVEHFEPDRRNFHQSIADNISLRGYTATAGEEGQTPEGADVLVTYIDKWFWDITNYMIELTITFRDSTTGAAVASGNSYHTSLTRKSPDEMIDEVLTNIFTADTSPAE